MRVHDERVARFTPLPWELNLELAEQVLSDFSRPERLPVLDDDFTKIVKQLSVSDGSEVPDFIFSPFRPSPPRAKIVRKIPVLKPAEEEVVEFQDDLEDIQDDVVEDSMCSGQPDEILIDVATEEEIEHASHEGDVVLNHEFEDNNDFSDELREMFGLATNGDSWEEFVAEPLDVRVQRLVRLAILLEKGGTEEHRGLQRKLRAIAKKLDRWTVERLSARHASSGNGLLKDAKSLGALLAEIPGPGTVIPVSTDKIPLPNEDDLGGLSTAISRLEKAVSLPSAKVPAPKKVEG